MANVKLEWDQYSIADSFSIYRSLSPINVASLPPPIGTTTDHEYTDYDIVADKTYYYRVASKRGDEIKVSSEINVFTSDDPNVAYLTNHLTFANSNLFDIKQSAMWTEANGSANYITSGGKLALNVVKPFNISSPNTLVVTDKFSLILDITFFDEPSYSQQAIAGLYASDPNEGISIFRFNSTSFAFYIGVGGVVEFNAGLINNSRMVLKIIKNPTTVKLYVNEVLKGTMNIVGNVPNLARLYVGSNAIDATRGLNALIHEVNYYHNFEIT